MKLPKKGKKIIRRSEIDEVAKKLDVKPSEVVIKNSVIVGNKDNALEVFEKWVKATLNVTTEMNQVHFCDDKLSEEEITGVLWFIKSNFGLASQLKFTSEYDEDHNMTIKYELSDGPLKGNSLLDMFGDDAYI